MDNFASSFALLQEGVRLKTRVGVSIQAFLEQDLGLSPEFVREKIKTVFLDGKPVDDYNRAFLKDNAVLSLSGALPGLVGATLRAGGFFAGLRSGITYRESDHHAVQQEGVITVKIFNTLLKELGPIFLKKVPYAT
jgi:hypothetical protein